MLQMHCDWLAGLSRRMLARRLEAADLVLGCSDHVTRQVRERFPGVRAETRYNGVDVDRFRPGPAVRRGRSCSRVAWGRTRACTSCATRSGCCGGALPDARLELVGPEAPVPREMQVALSDDPLVQGLDGLLRRQLRRGAARASRRRRRRLSTFRGAVAAADMPAAYARGTVGVLPSLEEAFGLPLVEAMACGLPTVATRVGGMPELARRRRDRPARAACRRRRARRRARPPPRRRLTRGAARSRGPRACGRAVLLGRHRRAGARPVPPAARRLALELWTRRHGSGTLPSPMRASTPDSLEPEGGKRPAPGRARPERTCPCREAGGNRRYLGFRAVAVAQLVEPRVVVPVVAGSSPVRHLLS